MDMENLNSIMYAFAYKHLDVYYKSKCLYTQTYIHTYMFVVVNFDALAQASDIRI